MSSSACFLTFSARAFFFFASSLETARAYSAFSAANLAA